MARVSPWHAVEGYGRSSRAHTYAHATAHTHIHDERLRYLGALKCTAPSAPARRRIRKQSPHHAPLLRTAAPSCPHAKKSGRMTHNSSKFQKWLATCPPTSPFFSRGVCACLCRMLRNARHHGRVRSRGRTVSETGPLNHLHPRACSSLSLVSSLLSAPGVVVYAHRLRILSRARYTGCAGSPNVVWHLFALRAPPSRPPAS